MYRVAAVAGAASALTTLALILLPRFIEPALSMEARVGRWNDPLYRLYLSVHALHPLLTLAAACAVAFWCRRVAPLLGVLAMGGFAAWALAELVQQCMSMVAYQRLAEAWPAAAGSQREAWTSVWTAYRVAWDTLYLFLLIGFLVGNAALMFALLRAPAGSRWPAVAYLGGALLTLEILVTELGGPSLLPGAVGQWTYLLFQPAARFAVACWLWTRSTASPCERPVPGAPAVAQRERLAA